MMNNVMDFKRIRRLKQQADEALLTREEAKVLAQQYNESPQHVICKYCGGVHPHHECWRVKRISYKGVDVVEVEFWYDWDKSDTIWMDDVINVAQKAED